MGHQMQENRLQVFSAGCLPGNTALERPLICNASRDQIALRFTARYDCRRLKYETRCNLALYEQN